MPQQNQQDSLQVELIRSLFAETAPAVIMSASFLVVGSLIAWETRNPLLAILVAIGTITTVARLIFVFRFKGEAQAPDLSIERARLLERGFAIAYFAFAGVLGMFGYYAMSLSHPGVHMLVMAMLVGYAGGVATCIALRPRIAVPSMLAAIIPPLNAALMQPDVYYWATALLASAFLIGGIHNLHRRNARAVQSISRRLAFSTLARQDGLTALPNRLALREWFDERVAFASDPGIVAVHFLDLDGFKPVNDNFGHSAGDALLAAVAKRIAGTIRASDTAARLGGDEFAIIQRGLGSADEAAQFARRLASAIARPYRIERQNVEISTSLGYVVAEHGAEDLECLLSLADEALYASKRRGGGVTEWTPDLDTTHRCAA
ncbi:GGDEF domain-containing protein [Novosphingobium sp. JCM 18896]|uniref:GGDEF domain-containing protein n=1 Tax=Novosphingobium sp. JCM 18896 TaxID=2989731 RepID=UPI0022229D0C|nr:GGDEF domain-containing protein [Novosphingobium sp. JCM 18896]MCW1429844.1 GGDEF domain-containing protein [Novosphingobium sp. JCM 18896]